MRNLVSKRERVISMECLRIWPLNIAKWEVCCSVRTHAYPMHSAHNYWLLVGMSTFRFFCDRTVRFFLPIWKKNFVSFRFCLKYKNKKTFLSISISKKIFLKLLINFFSFFVFRFYMETFCFFKTKFAEYNKSNIIELVKFYSRSIRY